VNTKESFDVTATAWQIQWEQTIFGRYPHPDHAVVKLAIENIHKQELDKFGIDTTNPKLPACPETA